MNGRRLSALLALVVIWLTVGCGPERLYPTLAAIPALTFSENDELLAGRLITLHYSWRVADDFSPPDRPQKAFVHFLDAAGKIGFTDDHVPPVDPRNWRPGELHKYSRRVILPDEPGELRVRLGFYSSAFPYRATVIDGSTAKSAFPIVATLVVRANDGLGEEAVAGGAGFGAWEIDGRASLRSTRWVRGRGVFTFLLPPEGARLAVRLQAYSLWGPLEKDPIITLRAGGAQRSEVTPIEDSVVLTLDVPGDGSARIVQGEIESNVNAEPGLREVGLVVERFKALPLSSAKCSQGPPRCPVSP